MGKRAKQQPAVQSGGMGTALAGIAAMAMANRSPMSHRKEAQDSLIMRILPCHDMEEAESILQAWEDEAMRLRVEVLPVLHMESPEVR